MSHPQFLRWIASISDEGHLEMLPISDDQPDGFKSALDMRACVRELRADEDSDAIKEHGGCA